MMQGESPNSLWLPAPAAYRRGRRRSGAFPFFILAGLLGVLGFILMISSIITPWYSVEKYSENPDYSSYYYSPPPPVDAEYVSSVTTEEYGLTGVHISSTSGHFTCSTHVYSSVERTEWNQSWTIYQRVYSANRLNTLYARTAGGVAAVIVLMSSGMGALLLCRQGRLRSRVALILFGLGVVILILVFFYFTIAHSESFDAKDIGFSGYQGKPGPAFSLTGAYNGTDQIRMNEYYRSPTVEQRWSIAWHPGTGWYLALLAILLLLVQMLPLGYLVYKFGRAPPPPPGGDRKTEQPVKGNGAVTPKQ